MRHAHFSHAAAAALGMALLTTSVSAQTADPLPSWNEGTAKMAIRTFVERVSDPASREFVPPAQRIATFDNDGTLWCEQPMYFQAFFLFDRVKQLAPEHPEWKEQEPFAAVLRGDLKAALASGEKGLIEMAMATHAGMTSEEFSALVSAWIDSARHPKSGTRFTEMVYQPMREVLAYLRANGFKTFIVSGGGIEFMRPWAEQVYGIPPEQIIGSSIKTKYELRDGKPVIARLPELNFIDDKAGKPVGIQQHIGRRPILAFGNSDGDFEMLEWTTHGSGPSLGILIHHTDAEREFAYDRESHIGKLDRGLLEAPRRGWAVVDMKRDWNAIFSAQNVTAINILLEPDQPLLERAEAVNRRLRRSDPTGFAFDATHRPHITLIQRFVRSADLERVYQAADEVFKKTDLAALRLEAFQQYYIPHGEKGLAGIVIRKTAELSKLQAELLAATAPFCVAEGTSSAFFTTPDEVVIPPELLRYVATFDREAAGEAFHPHLSTGVAAREFLEQLKGEPFESLSCAPTAAAVYQLGPWGTAARLLHRSASKAR